MKTVLTLYPFVVEVCDPLVESKSEKVGACLAVEVGPTITTVTLAIQDEPDTTAKSQGASASGFDKTAQALSRLAEKIGLEANPPYTDMTLDKWIKEFKKQNGWDGRLIMKMRQKRKDKGVVHL